MLTRNTVRLCHAWGGGLQDRRSCGRRRRGHGGSSTLQQLLLLLHGRLLRSCHGSMLLRLLLRHCSGNIQLVLRSSHSGLLVCSRTPLIFGMHE